MMPVPSSAPRSKGKGKTSGLVELEAEEPAMSAAEAPVSLTYRGQGSNPGTPGRSGRAWSTQSERCWALEWCRAARDYGLCVDNITGPGGAIVPTGKPVADGHLPAAGGHSEGRGSNVAIHCFP